MATLQQTETMLDLALAIDDCNGANANIKQLTITYRDTNLQFQHLTYDINSELDWIKVYNRLFILLNLHYSHISIVDTTNRSIVDWKDAVTKAVQES